MIIKLGIFERTPGELLAFIRQDWDERVHDKKDIEKGMLGLAFGASREFVEMKKLFNAFKAGYIEALKDKLAERKSISEAEIDNVRTLERLSLNFEYYYKGDHFAASERRLNTGAGINGHAAWKNIEVQAQHAGLLGGGDSYEVRIKTTHGTHYRIH